MGLRKISWLIISMVAIYAFRWGWLFRSSKPGPDAVGDVRVGHGLGEGLCRAPSGAVGRDDCLSADLGQSVDGGFDDRLECWTAEVKAADDRGNGVDAGESARLADDIDDPGVAAPRKHHQPVTGDMDDEGLIVEDERVGCPGPIGERLMKRHAVFEVGGAIDLAGDQHGIVEQQRGLAAFDDFQAGLLQCAVGR